MNRLASIGKAWLIAIGIAIGIIGLSAFSGLVGAQGGYMLTWYTIDGGGGSSSSSGYTLQGTSGQADAGNMSGRNYSLWGGFWGDPALNPSPTATAAATATPTSTATTTVTATSTTIPTATSTTTPTATATIEGFTPTATATQTEESPTPSLTPDGTAPALTETMTPTPTLTPDPSLIYHLYLPIQLR